MKVLLSSRTTLFSLGIAMMPLICINSSRSQTASVASALASTHSAGPVLAHSLVCRLCTALQTCNVFVRESKGRPRPKKVGRDGQMLLRAVRSAYNQTYNVLCCGRWMCSVEIIVLQKCSCFNPFSQNILTMSHCSSPNLFMHLAACRRTL